MQTRPQRLLSDPRVIDAAVVLGCLFLTVLAVKTPWSTLPRPVIAVVSGLGSLALWYRRRQPEAVAVAGAAACALAGNVGPLLVGLYSAASYGRRALVWAVTVVGWAGFTGWVWMSDGSLGVDDVIQSAVGAAAVAVLGLYTRTRRVLAQSWLARAEQAESERLLREEQARAAERTRIAREMHDVLAHKVSLIAVHAGALELAAQEPRARQGAALIRVTAREALQELRQILGILQADSTDPDPFTDLNVLVEEAARAGQRVHLEGLVGPLPPAAARVVHRLAQEALTNARKHAPGAAVSIAVATDGGDISVLIRNDRPATPPMDLPGSGAGLVGLAERVRLVGGTIHSGPTVDGGWELRADIPMPVAEETL
jgi:signal transduction histidine kinase